MWAMISLIVLGVEVQATQDARAQAQESIQALVTLKDGDEAGFDVQADRLLGLGEGALDPLEAALQGQSGEKAFLLRRIRDMIRFPLTLHGIFVIEPGDAAELAKAGVGPDAVTLAVNGQAVSGFADFNRIYQVAQKAGQKGATIEVLDKGRRRTVRKEAIWVSGSVNPYPHVLAEYLHHGHRGPAWDDLVQKSIEPWRTFQDADFENLIRAIQAGCRDPYVVFRVIRGKLERNATQEAVDLWKKLGSNLLAAGAYGDRFSPEITQLAAGALYETGDKEGALRLNEEARKAFQSTGPPRSLAEVLVQRAVFLEEKDPSRALDLATQGVARLEELRLLQPWRHDFLTHLRRQHGLWDEVATSAVKYGTDRNTNPAPLFDAHDMIGRFRRRTTEIIPTGRLYPTEDALRKGRPAGLRGYYYKLPNFEGDPVVRLDPQIYFLWGQASPMREMPKENYSVTWTGFLLPEFTGRYTFTVRVDDGARLWIDDRLVIDTWQEGTARYQSGAVDLIAGQSVSIKLEYSQRGGYAQIELYWDCPSFPAPAESVSWALVYRNAFELEATNWTFQDLPREHLKATRRAETGKLALGGNSDPGLSPARYASVRVEADLRLRPIAGDGGDGNAGLRAWVDPDRHTQIGFGLEWPSMLNTYLYFDRNGPDIYAPHIDQRKSHRLALEVHQGQATYFVDGKKIDFQFVPVGWSGFWGLKISGAEVELGNVEVYVPAPKAGDNEHVRGLYDGASALARRGDLPAALGLLEEAAALQPRVEELGRLYAAYLLGAGEGRAMLDRRFLAASHPQILRMLFEAEQQLDFLQAGEADCLLLRKVRSALDRGDPVESGDLKTLKESKGTGRLALYTHGMEEHYLRGILDAGQKEVVEAYRRAISQDPQALVHPYRLAAFLRAEHLSDQAAPLLQELKTRAPKVDPWKEPKDE